MLTGHGEHLDLLTDPEGVGRRGATVDRDLADLLGRASLDDVEWVQRLIRDPESTGRPVAER